MPDGRRGGRWRRRRPRPGVGRRSRRGDATPSGIATAPSSTRTASVRWATVTSRPTASRRRSSARGDRGTASIRPAAACRGGCSGSPATASTTPTARWPAHRRGARSRPTTPRRRPSTEPAELVDRLLVADALVTLAPRPREVLELAFYGGLSQTRDRRTARVPLGTVKSDMRRALLRLRHVLAGGDTDG